MNHKRLWTQGNKLRASEGRGVGDWDRPVMGIKEGTYCMEHWVLYANNESWNTTSKITMYCMVTNITYKKLLLKKRKIHEECATTSFTR